MLPKGWVRELDGKGGQLLVLEWHEGDRHID